MVMSELEKFKDQHGRLIYTNKIGFQNTLFGYIREINSDHIIFQDNEKPDKFKVLLISKLKIQPNINLTL